MVSLRQIPIRNIGSSDMHLRYLDEDPDLQPFLGVRPRNAEDLLRRAPMSARRLVSPESLSQVLLDYARDHDAPEEALANAEALADGDTKVIVTGQQPGLFGGPLYTLHKAATAVRLAQELNALPNAPRVVPVFWNHSDDHDLDETNRAFLVNGNLEVQRLRLDLDRRGEPIHNIGLGGHSMDHVLAAVGDMLPQSEFKESTLDLFRPRTSSEHFGDQLARLLFHLFGRHGLLVIEPRRLPPEAFDVLPRWWDQAVEIRAQAKSTMEILAEQDMDVSLDPSATLMFQNQGSRRLPMSEGDPVTRPTDLSPGVLLRPLWQDACLPSIGFVVGPGELGYLSVAGPLYRKLGVPMPVIVPRASLTLVEPSQAKQLKKFAWDITDLSVGPERLAERLSQNKEEQDKEVLGQLSRQVKGELGDLAKAIRELEPQMLRAVERTKSKVVEELDKLALKLRNSRNNRLGTGARQVRRLCSTLRPRGRLQERVLTSLPYLISHGPELGDHLVAAADPFTSKHGVLEL